LVRQRSVAQFFYTGNLDQKLLFKGRTMPHGYPRPQLERGNWRSLNGVWDFSIDRDGLITNPSDIRWDAHIQVPFAPECPASGLGNTGFYQACWYRRTVELDPLPDDHRLLVHFGAVDYKATV